MTVKLPAEVDIFNEISTGVDDAGNLMTATPPPRGAPPGISKSIPVLTTDASLPEPTIRFGPLGPMIAQP
jgi:hypothetical protein